jgi:hypothetical protein
LPNFRSSKNGGKDNWAIALFSFLKKLGAIELGDRPVFILQKMGNKNHVTA